MRYICLVHMQAGVFDGLTPEARAEVDRRSLAYDRQLQTDGHYVHADALEGGDSAVLVQVREGRVFTTDGPYMESKEQLGGFILIEARDMNEALRLAAGIPMAEFGTIEVRPIYKFPDPDA
ncbi:MAG: YciI family protein [Devosia sp.]